jgi:hypothetical protein
MSTAAAGAVAARSALHAAKAAESAAQKEERAAREAARERRQQRGRAARAELVLEVVAGREKARAAQVSVGRRVVKKGGCRLAQAADRCVHTPPPTPWQEAALLERRQAAESVRLQAEEDARTVAQAAAAEAAERREVILQLRGMEAAARQAASAGQLKVSDTTAVRLAVRVRVEWGCRLGS